MADVPGSIDPTGSNQVWNAMNNWMQSLPVGEELVFPDGARYRCDYRLFPKGFMRSTGVTTFFTDLDADKIEDPARTNHRSLIWELIPGAGALGIAVEGAKVPTDPYVESMQGQHAFEFIGCEGVEVEDCSASHVRGDFIYFGEVKSGGVWRVNSDVTVSLFIGDDCGRQGIALVSGTGYDIAGRLSNVARSLFDIEANRDGAVVENVYFHDVLGTNVRNAMFACHGQARVIRNVEIARVSMQNSTIRTDAAGNVERVGLYIHDCTSSKVMDSSQPPIKIAGWRDVTVENNTQRVDRSSNDPGVALLNMRGAYCVHDNDFPLYDKFTNQATGGQAQQFTVTMLTGVANPGNCTTPVTARPVINSPIFAGATVVSGTSSEAAGTIVQVYVNGVAQGAVVTVTAGAWSKSGLASLTDGQVVTAKATAPGKTLSATSNSVTVTTQVQTSRPTLDAPVYAGSSAVTGSTTEADGTVITVRVDTIVVGSTASVGGRWTQSNIGPLATGQRIRVQAAAPGKSNSTQTPNVTVTEPPPVVQFRVPPRRFRWSGSVVPPL